MERIMTTHYLRRIRWFLLFWLSSFCAAQVVTIRVIEAADGRPLQKQRVSVSLLYDKNEPTPTKYDAVLSLETDQNGEAQFRLPEPAPAHLATQVNLTSEHWRCGCSLLATTRDLIQKGIVEPKPGPESKKSAVLAKAEPGEILILARRLTLFERLLYPLMKQ
jgi:hypothetical protein